MSSSSSIGCWLTDVAASARSTPGWSARGMPCVLELLPGGAKKDLSAAQACKLLVRASSRPVRGASVQSSAAGSHPYTDSLGKSLPGPVKAKPKAPFAKAC